VVIQRNGNVGIDVTAEIHPAVAEAAVLAARVVGLDIAGIDMVCENIARSLEEQGGAIVEVNAGPSLLMHLKPVAGQARPVGRAIVEHLFPEGRDGYIPIVGVGGSHVAASAAKLIARLIQLDGKYCGLACADGLFLDHRQILRSDCSHWDGAHRLLLNPLLEAAVIETSAESILREGLAYDRCRVAVVMSLDPFCPLPEYFVETPKQIFNVLRTLVDVVQRQGTAVLNADDEQVAAMAELCDGKVILFGTPEGAERIEQHCAMGRRAVRVQNGMLTLLNGETVHAEWPLPTDLKGITAMEIAAAAGAAWALNISVDVIRAGGGALMGN
jgi:cyanophycin synthetase